MRSLIHKEFRSLLPFILLLSALAAFDFATELATDPPDQRPIAQTWTDYFGESRSFGIAYFILAFAMAQGLLVRETEDRAIEFLDALPVTRTQVFWVKAAAGYATLLIAVLANAAMLLVLHAWSLNSLEPTLRLRAIGVAAGLQAAQVFVFFSAGLALSFLRRFAWAAAGLAFWAFIALKPAYPGLQALDPFALTDAPFVGGAPVVPWRMLAIQCGIAAALLVVAWGIFAGAAEAIQRAFDSLARNPAGGILLAVGAAIIVIAWGAAFAYMSGDEMKKQQAEKDEDVWIAARFTDWSVSRASTRRYDFVYPAQLSERARGLIDRADEIHDKVAAFLGEEPGARIDADLTGASADHAGLAYWNKLRMSLEASEDPGMLATILGHETAHVFAGRMARQRFDEAGNSTRFFNEGLATFIEHRLDGSGEASPFLFMAAVARARKEADFEEMADNEAFCAKRDTNLIYGLGEAFIAAVVRLHGDGAPAEILRAFGRENAPEDLDGVELWRDTFQAAGYNLDSAIDEFYAVLDEAAKTHAEEIATLPRLRAEVDADATEVRVRVDAEAPEGWRIVCRFRQGKRDSERDYIDADPRGEGTFTAPRTYFRGSSAWYQAGLAEQDGLRTIWEPWAQAKLEGGE